jgi:PAS domain S-box-containing protein
MRKLSLAMIFLFLFLSGFALHAETKVRVGIYQNEPKVFVDSTGKAQGVFVDIIEYIAAEEGWTLEYVLGTWDEGLSQLVAGEIDLMVDVAYSQERIKKFSFQKHTVLSNWAQVYVSKGSDIQSILDLEGKNVAGLKGDMSYERLVSTVKQFGITCHFVEADEFLEIFEFVDNGTADAGIISHMFGLKHEHDFDVVKSPIIFNPMELRYATAKGQNTELLEAIDRYLVAMKSDSSSVYHRSINKWIATDLGSRDYVPNWVWWILGSALGLVGLFFLHHGVLHRRVKKMTAELRNNNEKLQDEIAVRKEAEDELTKYKEQLEDTVAERTRDLRESEERYRSIFENATMGIFRTSAAGRILTANPAGADILGYDSVGELIEAITDLAQQLYANPEERQVVLKLMQEQGKATLELDLLRKDGSILDAKLNMWMVTDDDGKLRFLEGFIEDITERKLIQNELQKAQSKLMQSEKMASLGMLVAGIAHEFNNPISAVQSAGDTLKIGINKFEVLCNEYAAQTNSPSLQAHELLTAIRNCQRVIETGAERVASIVQRMKTFARLDEAETQHIDLNQNLKDTIAVFQHEIKPGITLRTDLQELPTFGCSPAKLNQLFIHLLRNANQACEDGAEILVSSRSEMDTIRIAISDTGRGIPQKDVSRIFDPGFTTREVGIDVGLGLGLPICYQIAQEHQGSIEVESQVGSGSTFIVILPSNPRNQ